MKNGIELIAEERNEQIVKHGRTIERDVKENVESEMSYFAGLLCHMRENDAVAINYTPPKWNRALCKKMLDKPYKERLIIAGALIAAEIDRLQNS